MTWIRTLPVYSRLADEGEVRALGLWDRLPANPDGSRWRLSQHQVETYKALTLGNAEVIFNTAMTGDGKSLAGQLPTLLQNSGRPLFAMYPTNELVYDQRKQLERAKHEWKAASLVEDALDSARLDAMMAGDDFSQRGEALLSLISNKDVVLTNPDIFHYVMEFFYRFPGDAPDKIIGPLVDKFRQFTFDEFHVFETPQVISVVNAMLFITEMMGVHAPRYLFLSATPDEQMLAFLDRSGLRYQEINPARAGWYAHAAGNPDPSLWRRILHESDIHVATGRVEEWVDAHLEDVLLPFFRENKPNAKGAIIVNSVAAAMRLQARLAPIFAAHGLVVRPNTGLTSRAGRAASYEADLLIGTSTVDVGVDFQINFLLFESLNAGTFVQRLGRLGRHDGYYHDGRFNPFEKFEARALVPEWVAEALFQGREGAGRLLDDGQELDREGLSEAIREAYPQPATFDGYVQDWGRLQSTHVIMNLNRETVRSQYAQTRDRLGRRYQGTFNISIGRAHAEWIELKKAGNGLLIEEALSFRGGSYFQCAILDETEEGSPEPKLYDLFALVTNGKLGELEEEEFYAAVKGAGLAKRRFDTANGDNGPLAYFRLLGWRGERREYELRLGQYIAGWGSDRFGHALALNGFELTAPGVPMLTALNNRLRRRHLPATLCLAFGHPLELKRRLYLPPLFPVFRFTSRDRVAGCVAFGREALLLHTRLNRRQVDSGGGAMII
jgi:CRISPR-associated endonuclease/helicase Cas3